MPQMPYNIPYDEYLRRCRRAFERGEWGEIECMLLEIKDTVKSAQSIVRKNNYKKVSKTT